MDRVKFLSTNDLMYGYYLENSEKLIKEYNERKVQDINRVIELYNAIKYFENEVYLPKWIIDDINRYKETIKIIWVTIAKFFNSITEDSLISFYSEVDIEYKDEFWELIEKFKVYKKISEDKFKEFINTSEVRLYELLKHRNTIEHFGKIIRDSMIDDCSSAELLLDKYEMAHIVEKDILYFPKELSNPDKENIICNYINSEDPNLNYLRLISNIQSSKDKIELSPKILLNSKKRAEELEKRLFPENSGMRMETCVSFSKLQDEEFIVKIEEQKVQVTYSIKWIENNKDFSTLLNNFIYLFEFVDSQMRCLLVNKFNYMGVFERFLFTNSKNAYIKGIAFDQTNVLSLLQMAGYYNTLSNIGIRLEEVIEWFFEEYLGNEFNAHDFKISMPSASSTFLEKCTTIMPAMESALKQFSLFVQDGQVDFDLLEIRSEHLLYKNIPSLVYKKYIYSIGDEFRTASYFLFSDQSGLGYNDKTQKSYKNYFERLCREKNKLEDYPAYCLPKINWLIEHKYLSIDEKESVLFRDKIRITILKDLYFNGVISYWDYPESGRKVLDELEKNKVIEFESSLFTRPEQDYINYLLNKSRFNNGLDLRNKYVHTQPRSNDDETIHNQNYMILLRLFILTIIKINHDFCLLDEIKS